MSIPTTARLLILACMLVAACVSRGASQIPTNCHAILATLEHNPQQVKLWSQAGRCGDAGARAVANAFRQNRASRDVAYWAEFGEVAYGSCDDLSRGKNCRGDEQRWPLLQTLSKRPNT
jgi:hypothetical protein